MASYVWYFSKSLLSESTEKQKRKKTRSGNTSFMRDETPRQVVAASVIIGLITKIYGYSGFFVSLLLAF